MGSYCAHDGVAPVQSFLNKTSYEKFSKILYVIFVFYNQFATMK